MKKFILPAILFIFSILLITLSANYAHAQDKEPIGCDELKKIFGSGECPDYVIDVVDNGGVWCSVTVDEIIPEEGLRSLYRNRPPDYVIDPSSDFFSEDPVKAEKCIERTGNQETSAQPDQSQSDKVGQPTKQNQTVKDGNPLNIFGINPLAVWRNIQNLLTLNEMVVATGKQLIESREVVPEESPLDELIKNLSGKGDSNVNTEIDPIMIAHIDEILNRTPEMTEEIINQYQAEQKALYEGPEESPYRLDILEGEIQIKLPGQNEWSDLKVGDKIPPGSTIFTGMDTTTVLSIKDKGVVQILSFTEVTISEEGLAEPGKTTTELDLRAGEVELDVKGPTFGPSFQVFTTNSTTGVRGTHFWVRHDDKRQEDVIGVYEGKVEVKANDGQTTTVSPDGDKPGVVIVTQKLSTVKLFIAGAVAVIIIGGIIFFLEKRAKSGSRGKR